MEGKCSSIFCCIKRNNTPPKSSSKRQSRKSSHLPMPKRGILKTGQSTKNLPPGHKTTENFENRRVSPEVSLKHSSNNDPLRSEKSSSKVASENTTKRKSLLKYVPIYRSTTQQKRAIRKFRKNSTPIVSFKEPKCAPRKSSFYKHLVHRPKRNTIGVPVINAFDIKMNYAEEESDTSDLTSSIINEFNSYIPMSQIIKSNSYKI
ncbi:unnamed protein product [Moneuplotes crassus]|uniref:Uncharacterized protein n=1 Tax=Euplotes crassus TaxID=5936 RepID=A0AAD1U2X2_EUPCR|nr:unnamed protein product [Moneuplotes crassus]